jgi:hypothetical protein
MLQGQRGLQATGAADTTTTPVPSASMVWRRVSITSPQRPVASRHRGRVLSARQAVSLARPCRDGRPFLSGHREQRDAQRITVDVSGEARADMQLVDVRTSRSRIVRIRRPGAGAMITPRGWRPDFTASG